MSDPDMRDFFKGSNKAKKYNDEWKKKKKQQKQENQIPMAPFSPATIPPPVLWKEPQPPINVVTNGGYPEWEWMGKTFRPYYAGNLWLNCDASHVYFAFRNWETDTITNVRRLDVKIDANGKQYVENWVNKVLTQVYLDDALKTCFHTSIQSLPISATSQNVPQANSIKRPNVTIFTYKGEEYAFYYEGKFCVSKKNGKAAWLKINWETKTHNQDAAKPYDVFSRKDGTLAVNVKQQSGSYVEFDMAKAICRTFNGNPTFPDMIVKFRDGNVGNCDADNLYWDMP